MSSKIFAILAILVLVMSPIAMAQYGYLPPSGGGDKDYPLEIELDSSCEGNVVTVYRKNTPETVTGAHVTVTDATGAPVFSGDTDGNGQVMFEGCGMTVVIHASKAGFIADDETHDLVPCEQCGEPRDSDGDGIPDSEDRCPDQPETFNDYQDEDGCPDEVPPEEPTGGEDGAAPGGGEDGGPEFECTENADCEDAEYCAIAVGAAGGDCMPVTGVCGYVEDHAWVQYECGPEAGCPSCGTGYECLDRVCVVSEEEPVGGAAAPGEGEGGAGGAGGEGAEDGFPWWILLGGLIVFGGILGLVWWFLSQGGKGRR